MARIAITLNTSWNIYNFRLGLVKALQRQGFEVIAIAPQDEFSPLLVKEGCTFVPVSMENKGSNPISDLGLMIRLYRIYKKIKPDIVLQYTIKPNIYGSMAAKLAGIPVVNNVSGLGTVFLHNNVVSKIAQGLYKIAFRFPRKVFFQNSEDQKLFISKGLVQEQITSILPGSGVDLEKFKPEEKVKGNPFVFLVIARVLFDKGIVEYANAARLLKEKNLPIKCQLLGSLDPGPLGVPEYKLQEWKREGILEYIPFQKDIRSFVANADAVILPSYREGTPKTLLEAAAMGKPLIATDVPGCRDVVSEGVNGYLCQVKDSNDLAAKMEKMAALTQEELNRLGRNSRERVVLLFDERLVIKAYLDAIQEIIPEKINLAFI